ncbi:hypothetical protein FXO37_19374 [Capsicum annuum]|nr:hypothetical protein FXO37_19374 [Capsicum annuum]
MSVRLLPPTVTVKVTVSVAVFRVEIRNQDCQIQSSISVRNSNSSIDSYTIPSDSGRYKDFPWGSLSFEDLARSLNIRLKAGGQFYMIQEMSLAIQVWLYEWCSNVLPKIVSKVDNRIPRLLNWKTIAPRPRFEFLMNALFNDNGKVVFKNIQPTKKELAKLQIPKKDAIQHERSVNSDDDFQDPPPRKINEHSTKKQKDQVVDIEVDKSNVDEGGLEQSGQHFSPDQHADKDPDLQNMDYVGTERSPQRLSSEVDQELGANLLGKKGCTDLHSEKMNVEIDSQQLIPDELLQSINLNYLHSEKVVQHDCRVELATEEQVRTPPNTQEVTNDEQRDEQLWPDSQNTIPNEFLPNLNEHHLIEYINGFRMYAAVPWHTVEDIFIPVNIKEKHYWVLVVLLFSERCIFLYDSYESSGHYAAVLAETEKIAMIIPLCVQACDFYVKKGIDLQNHPRYKDKESSDMFDVLFEYDLPQQLSGSLNYGIFMIMYAECLSYGHKVIETEFDPNALHTRYAALLWDYEIRKQEANAISDVEAPLRPAGQSRITSVTKVVDV